MENRLSNEGRQHLLNRVGITMHALGNPSKFDGGYCRFQKVLGIKKTTITTLVVYFENVGANLLELAFETEAVALCVPRSATEILKWISDMCTSTGREVNINSRYKYPRIGIGSAAELENILKSWSSFVIEVDYKQHASNNQDDFVKVPFYIEKDGSKTLFLPELRRGGDFKIGPKGSEHSVVNYWEALEALNAMPVARFRRPNNVNNYGIVRCRAEDFDEVKKSFIQEQLNSLQT